MLPPLQAFLHIFFSVCVQAGENVEDITGGGVLRLLLQPWEAREVAVVFTPSDHKPTTTILIIRYGFIEQQSLSFLVHVFRFFASP